MQKRNFLCALCDVPENGSKGFESDGQPLFVVREGEQVQVYVNRCPHLGTPLEFMPDHFLNVDKTHVLCSTHGALFRKWDGHCVAGPCAGAALETLPFVLIDGAIYLTPMPQAQ